MKVLGKVFPKGSETKTHNGQHFALYYIKHMWHRHFAQPNFGLCTDECNGEEDELDSHSHWRSEHKDRNKEPASDCHLHPLQLNRKRLLVKTSFHPWKAPEALSSDKTCDYTKAGHWTPPQRLVQCKTALLNGAAQSRNTAKMEYCIIRYFIHRQVIYFTI